MHPYLHRLIVTVALICFSANAFAVPLIRLPQKEQLLVACDNHPFTPLLKGEAVKLGGLPLGEDGRPKKIGFSVD